MEALIAQQHEGPQQKGWFGGSAAGLLQANTYLANAAVLGAGTPLALYARSAPKTTTPPDPPRLGSLTRCQTFLYQG